MNAFVYLPCQCAIAKHMRMGCVFGVRALAFVSCGAWLSWLPAMSWQEREVRRVRRRTSGTSHQVTQKKKD